MIFFGLKIYKDSDSFNLRCIISKVDGNTYCVRERGKLELAADLLAEATKNMKKLVKYMEQKHSSNPAVKRLVENFNPDKISETLPTSEHTAYSENKGEKMAFCLKAHQNVSACLKPVTISIHSNSSKILEILFSWLV